MTRRERLEAKLAKRAEWADKARDRSAQRWHVADQATAGIPFGQPILVGHHSEARHRAALDKADRNMRKACEESDLAKHHDSRADGLAAQLDRSIFSDDPVAIDALGDRIDALTAKRDEMKRANAYWRKHKSMKGFPGLSDESAARLDADIPTRYSWERQPFPSYTISNLGARIRQAAERQKIIAARAERTERAAETGVLIEGTDYVRVTFPDKPDRDILDALRAANFRWSGGSWCGYRAALPESVTAMGEG